MEDPLATGEVTKKKAAAVTPKYSAAAFASRALGFAETAAAAINAASLRLISRKEAAAWAAKKAEKEAAKAAKAVEKAGGKKTRKTRKGKKAKKRRTKRR